MTKVERRASEKCGEQAPPAGLNGPRVLVVAGLVLLVAAVWLLKPRSEPAAVGDGRPDTQLASALAEGRPTLAFFHSLSCAACLEMTRVVAEVLPEYRETVALVDVDVYDDRNAPLLRQERIQAIPTLVFYDRAGKRQVHVGVMDADGLRVALAALTEGKP